MLVSGTYGDIIPFVIINKYLIKYNVKCVIAAS